MKKVYETPKAELLDFDNTDIVTTSGQALTDASTEWWTCEERIVDVKNIEGTVCGYVPH